MALISCCSLHGGAKATQKHERVALTPQQDAAQCDICQVRAAGNVHKVLHSAGALQGGALARRRRLPGAA